MAFSGTRSAILAALASLLLPDGLGNLQLSQSPPQFDNSLKVASTAFVNSSMGQFAGSVGLGVSTVLTAADCGLLVNCTGVGNTHTLPLASAVPIGGAITFQNTAGGVLTVQRQSTDTISIGGATLTSIAMNYGDNLIMVKMAPGLWFAMGSAALNGSGQFAQSKAAAGYQKLPGGVILQWGPISSVPVSGVTVAFPLAFPNACVSMTAFISSNGSFAGSVSGGPLNTSQFQLWSSAGSPACIMFALGY
jgi:hypothetical protein